MRKKRSQTWLSAITRPAIDRANAGAFQDGDDLARRFIDFVRTVVELQVGDRPRRRADVLAVHPQDQAHERFRAGQDPLNVVLLVRDRRPADLHKSNVVRAGIKADFAKPRGIQGLGPHRLARGPPLRAHGIVSLSGVQPVAPPWYPLFFYRCIYIYLGQKKFHISAADTRVTSASNLPI